MSTSKFISNRGKFIVLLGMLCCAQYSLDDEWYRGKIKAVRTPENVATNEITGADVLFVDYGTFETVPLER